MTKAASFTIVIIPIVTILFVRPFSGQLIVFGFSLHQLRLLYILPATNPRRPHTRRRGTPTHLLIVLGSGGHSAEMFSLLATLDPYSYNHRTYVVSAGDDFSVIQAKSFENDLTTRATTTQNLSSQTTREEHRHTQFPSYSLHVVPRARRIHQPLLTTPLSSLRCLLASISLLHSLPTYPDLILLNGPATSTILLLSALVVRFFDWRGRTRGKLRSIYVESWARVKRLSLSARIITTLGAADRVLVQWEGLAGKGEYRGCLIR